MVRMLLILLKKIFINLGTIPCLIGILLFIINLNMPVYFSTTLSYLGNMCTPVSMLIIGALIGRRNLVSLFTSFKVYYLSAMKLIVTPLIVCLVMKLLGVNTEMILFMTTVCALPSATMVSMLAEMHNINPEFSAQLVGMSSLLCVVTIPVILKIAELIV